MLNSDWFVLFCLELRLEELEIFLLHDSLEWCKKNDAVQSSGGGDTTERERKFFAALSSKPYRRFYHPSRALLPFLYRCFLLPFRFTAAAAATYAVLCCICVHAASFLCYMISIFLSFSPSRRLSSLSLRFFVDKNKIFWVKTLIFWRELHCPEAHCLDPSNYALGLLTKFALSQRLRKFFLSLKVLWNLVKAENIQLWI